MDNSKKAEIGKVLNIYLANLNVLNTKLHNYHWNVVGPDFFDLHEELQTMYETILSYFDEVAERIVILGSLPIGTLEEALQLSTITETKSQKFDPKDIVPDLIEDFNEMIAIARYAVYMAGENRDDGTIAMLTDNIKFFEKMIWFLSAYLSEEVNIC